MSFCPKCGVEINGDKELEVCPNCGAVLNESNKASSSEPVEAQPAATDNVAPSPVKEKKSKGKKILIIAIVVIVALFLLAGVIGLSSHNKEKAKFVGLWKLQVDYTKMLEESWENFDIDVPPTIVTVYWEMGKDGSYKTYVDEDELKSTEENINKALLEAMRKMMQDTIDEAGMTDEISVDELVKEEFGCTLEEYVEKEMSMSSLTESFKKEFNKEGYYHVDGTDKFCRTDEDCLDSEVDYTEGSYDTYEWKSDDCFWIVDESDFEDFSDLDYDILPLVFERVK